MSAQLDQMHDAWHARNPDRAHMCRRPACPFLEQDPAPHLPLACPRGHRIRTTDAMQLPSDTGAPRTWCETCGAQLKAAAELARVIAR